METEGKKSLYIKTFGCQMNEYDSEKMVMLLSGDYSRVDSPEEADLILVNTCSVREKSESKLFGLLGTFKVLKEKKPNLVIGVGGCLAQQEGKEITKRSAVVDFVVGTHNISLVPSLVKGVGMIDEPQIAIDYREEWEELPDELDILPSLGATVQSTFNTPVRALIAIQRGCDKMCSYCVVPGTRGPQVSRALNEILKEVRAKVKMGASEVMLLGQTVNSYGLDLSPRTKFSDLVKSIAEVEGLKRIRFISPHPQEVRDDFIKLFSQLPILCPHIHLPLQSGSNRILKLMNRNYKKERYLEIVSALRDSHPDIVITTDIIVGFPTESEEDFEETLDIISQVKFQTSFSYKYSIRPNTLCKTTYSTADEVLETVKQERLSRLLKLQSDLTLGYNSSLIGSEQEILVEAVSDSGEVLKGRTAGNIFAEISMPNYVKSISGKSLISKLVKGRVVRASPHGLKLIESKEFTKIMLSDCENNNSRSLDI